MPIVIDEVVISVTVEQQATGAGGSPASTASSEDRHALVAECVERVLEVLAQREER